MTRQIVIQAKIPCRIQGFFKFQRCMFIKECKLVNLIKGSYVQLQMPDHISYKSLILLEVRIIKSLCFQVILIIKFQNHYQFILSGRVFCMISNSIQKTKKQSKELLKTSNFKKLNGLSHEYLSTQNSTLIKQKNYQIKQINQNKQNNFFTYYGSHDTQSHSRYNKQKSLIKSNSQKVINILPRTTLKQLTQQYELSLSNLSYKANSNLKLNRIVQGNQKGRFHKQINHNYKLCINCLNYVNSQLIIEHEAKCMGFNIILKMSKEDLIQFIDFKIEAKIKQNFCLKAQIKGLNHQKISKTTKLQSLFKKNDQIIEDLSAIRLRALKLRYKKR